MDLYAVCEDQSIGHCRTSLYGRRVTARHSLTQPDSQILAKITHRMQQRPRILMQRPRILMDFLGIRVKTRLASFFGGGPEVKVKGGGERARHLNATLAVNDERISHAGDLQVFRNYH